MVHNYTPDPPYLAPGNRQKHLDSPEEGGYLRPEFRNNLHLDSPEYDDDYSPGLIRGDRLPEDPAASDLVPWSVRQSVDAAADRGFADFDRTFDRAAAYDGDRASSAGHNENRNVNDDKIYISENKNAAKNYGNSYGKNYGNYGKNYYGYAMKNSKSNQDPDNQPQPFHPFSGFYQEINDLRKSWRN